MKMNARFRLTISLVLLVYSSINFALGWNLLEWLHAIGADVAPGLFWPVFALVVYGYVAGRFPLPTALKPVGRLLKVLGSYYVFLFEIGLLLVLLADLGALGVWVAGGDTGAYGRYAGAVVVVLLAAMMAVGSRNAWSPVVRTYELQVDKPVEGRKEWTIAVASDLHLGNVVGKRHLRRLVRFVNAMQPDLVLLPGDVLDDSIEPFLRNNMSEVMGELKAEFGVYAILGNHEYFGGHIEQYVDEMRKIGIRVLRDETAQAAGGVQIAGRKDRTADAADPPGRMPVEQLIGTLDPQRPIILLDHQPNAFQLAANAGADILLCGHTHRGQFAPNHWITRRMFELDWGYMRKDRMHVVVSSGFGLWGPPVRIASRSEIVRLNVKFR